MSESRNEEARSGLIEVTSTSTLLEEGLAFPADDTNDWVYTVQRSDATPDGNRLVIRAKDLAGNATEQEKILK